MKKFAAVVSIIILAVFTYFLCLNAPSASEERDFLRIHVRANSNMQCDQSVKYIVKDEVVKFITPYIGECTDKDAAIEVISGIIPEIVGVCERTLKENGFDYGARAEVRQENFPTRVYGEYTLEEGVYDALIIELGTGTGDNWWCVIYPPLCFTSATQNVEYRSVIMEIIEKFRKSH